MIAWLRGAPIEVVLILLVSVIGVVSATYIAARLWRSQRDERTAKRVAPLLELRKHALDIRDRCRGTPEDTRRRWADVKALNEKIGQALKEADASAEDIAWVEIRDPIPKTRPAR